jgi:predicted DNA-binding protein with PD1-like motif
MLLMRGFESFSLTSSALSIEVKPLPKGAPSNFTGGVGAFKTAQKLSSTEVKQGEMITLTRTISGHGNLHLIDFPELKLPDGLELYGDPEVKESFSFSSEGSKGKITHTYHLKALKAGNVQLPSFTLAYFDPEKAQYSETETTTKNLHITGDPNVETAESSIAKGKTEETFHQANRSDAEQVGESLIPNWIWIALTGLFALISIKLFRERKTQKTVVSETQAEPVSTFETTQATSPNTHLANARSALDTVDLKTFHTQTEKAVIVALANFLKSSEQNRSVLLSHMEGHPNKTQFSQWFSDFDASRYGMGISGAEPKELLERAEQLIGTFQG